MSNAKQHENVVVKNQGAKFWDSNPCGGEWTNYRDFMEFRKTEPYIYEILDQYDWHEKKVVEIGCGQGATLNYLPPLGAMMYGLDMSFQSVRQARWGAQELGHPGKVIIVQSDAEQIPFASESFDMAVSGGVLHHTADTARGVKEIYRLLKPGGVAIVMLYRSGNPKWWMTNLFRNYSRFVDFIYKSPGILVERARARHVENSTAGTAFLELFGVPILNAYSNRQARKMFYQFSDVKITNHEPGFRRMADVLPVLKPFESILKMFDCAVWSAWGFCQVIEATK